MEGSRESFDQGGYPLALHERAGTARGHGIGALLRASRLRCGEDIADVAAVLCIRRQYLEAIEDGHFHVLPAPTYAVGFIRAYAEHLGLDSDEVVRRYKIETHDLGGATELSFPVPIPETGVPGGAIVFVGAIVALLAYGGWYVSSTKDGFFAELIAPLPSRLAALLQGDVPVPAVFPAAGGVQTGTGPGTATAAMTEETAWVAADRGPFPVEAPPAVGADRVAETGALTIAAGVGPSDTVPTADFPVVAALFPGSVRPHPAADPVPVIAPAAVAPPPAVMTPPPPPAEAMPPAAIVKTPSVVAMTPPPAAPLPVTSSPVVFPSRASAIMAPQPNPTAADSGMASQTAATAEPVSNGRIYGAENDGARIVVVATADSWIQVRDEVGQQLLVTRLLRPGDSYRVPNRSGLKLLTGNAGALEILVDGRAAPSLGPLGAVRRDVALDTESLLRTKTSRD